MSGPRHQFASRRGKKFDFSWQLLSISFSVEKEDGKYAFLLCTFDDNVVNGELAAEPVSPSCARL